MDFEKTLAIAQEAFMTSDYQAAETNYQQALNELIIANVDNNAAVIIVALNYADFLSQLDRYEEARPLIRQACQIATYLHLVSNEAA